MSHVLCKTVLIAGTILGWAGAIAAVAMAGLIPHERLIPAMLVLLSVALISSACLVTRRYQRPIGDAYELGYNRGRRDAMLEANRSQVTPLRKVSG